MTLPVRAMPPEEDERQHLRNALQLLGGMRAMLQPEADFFDRQVEEFRAAIERRVLAALALLETGSPP